MFTLRIYWNQWAFRLCHRYAYLLSPTSFLSHSAARHNYLVSSFESEVQSDTKKWNTGICAMHMSVRVRTQYAYDYKASMRMETVYTFGWGWVTPFDTRGALIVNKDDISLHTSTSLSRKLKASLLVRPRNKALGQWRKCHCALPKVREVIIVCRWQNPCAHLCLMGTDYAGVVRAGRGLGPPRALPLSTLATEGGSVLPLAPLYTRWPFFLSIES